MSISCINAQDFNESQISDSNDEIQSAHNEDILNEGEGSLSELTTMINDAPTNSEIKLTKNFTYKPAIDNPYVPTNGIVINKKITIDGQGHTINFMNSMRGFRITGKEVTLKNLVITNANITRRDSSDTNLGVIYWDGINGTVNNEKKKKNYESIQNLGDLKYIIVNSLEITFIMEVVYLRTLNTAKAYVRK